MLCFVIILHLEQKVVAWEYKEYTPKRCLDMWHVLQTYLTMASGPGFIFIISQIFSIITYNKKLP
jgi:hypothetical protein